MRKNMLLLAVLALLAASGPPQAEARGEGEGDEEKQELTDKLIDERKAHLDDMLAKMKAEIEKNYAERVAFMTAEKNALIAFETQRVSDRKTFLDTLKGKKGDERREAMRAFNEREHEKRKAFHDEQRDKMEEFHKAHQEQRREHREGMRKEHEEMREQRHEEMRKHKEEMQEKHRQEKQEKDDNKKD